MYHRFLRRLLLYLFSSFLVITSIAQTSLSWACGDDKINLLQTQLTPGYEQKHQLLNLQLRQYINLVLQQNNKIHERDKRTSGEPQDGIFTIPVVIHVVYPAGEAYGSGSNISYAQIRSQIEALNAAYSRSYPTYNGESHPGYAQNTNIRFCLARTPSPSGISWGQRTGWSRIWSYALCGQYGSV